MGERLERTVVIAAVAESGVRLVRNYAFLVGEAEAAWIGECWAVAPAALEQLQRLAPPGWSPALLREVAPF